MNDVASEGKRTQLGEVIATSYGSFVVESYELNSTPPLGSLVVAQNVVGVVCAARTEGLGPISAKGSMGDEDGSVYRMHPDLQRTLRSQFSALVVGCYDEKKGASLQQAGPIYAYPECPPRVHYKCWSGTDEELIVFTSRPDYLRLLLFSPEAEATNIDQVLIHLIVKGFKARNGDREWLSFTAEYLGRQLKGQYDRLVAILKTLDVLTQSTPTADEASMALPEAVGQVKF